MKQYTSKQTNRLAMPTCSPAICPSLASKRLRKNVQAFVPAIIPGFPAYRKHESAK